MIRCCITTLSSGNRPDALCEEHAFSGSERNPMQMN